jgi:hypothetical protein
VEELVPQLAPLKNLFSLTEPLGPPSPLAPLSETRTTIVLSRSPICSRKARRRPISWSVWLRNPAYTSAMRVKSRFSSSASESHGRTTSTGFHGLPSTLVSSAYGFSGVSAASAGKMPICFCRSNTSSR